MQGQMTQHTLYSELMVCRKSDLLEVHLKWPQFLHTRQQNDRKQVPLQLCEVQNSEHIRNDWYEIERLTINIYICQWCWLFKGTPHCCALPLSFLSVFTAKRDNKGSTDQQSALRYFRVTSLISEPSWEKFTFPPQSWNFCLNEGFLINY